MRRALRFLAVACFALAFAPGMPFTFAAGSSTLDTAGWWSKTQQLPVEGDPTGLGVVTVPTVPAPATVPEEGLYVANDASGATAISAVRYRLEDETSATLTLRLADGAALTGAEEIVACPVVGGFQGSYNGRWDARPSYEEETCTIEAQPTEESDALTFDLPSTFVSAFGDLAVVVVPLPGSATPFSLAFEPPADDDLVVTGGGASSPSFTPIPSSPPAASPAPSPARPSFSSPSVPSVAPPPVAEPSSDSGSAAPVTPVASTPAALPEPSRVSQIVAAGLLAAIGGAMWWLSGRPERAPRLLGSVGGRAPAESPAAAEQVRTDARPRGVGRFARPRTVPASRI